MNIFLLVLLLCPTLPGVEVANDQSGRWSSEKSPYIVTGDIQVPHGATLVIESGVRVLFNGFFTLCVKGSLIAEGTEFAPIFFSSAKDTAPAGAAADAEPMDWNHFDILETGALQLRHCVIAYSFDVMQSLSDRIYLEHILLKKTPCPKSWFREKFIRPIQPDPWIIIFQPRPRPGPIPRCRLRRAHLQFLLKTLRRKG